MHLKTPIIINKIPDIIFHFFKEVLYNTIRFPRTIPILRNKNWKRGTSIGNSKLYIPNDELVIPTQIESKERANDKYNASFFSITFELFKSEDIGFLMICIVIPKDFRNILWLLYSFFSLVFIASYIIKNPIKTRRITLIIFITLAGRIEIRKYPNATEIPTKSNETKNKINFAGVDNDVFLSPYVIPIPNESILTDKASKIIVSSIISPLYIICKLKK